MRNYFLVVLLFAAAIYVATMRLVIPADATVSYRMYVATDRGSDSSEGLLTALSAEGERSPNVDLLASRDQVIAAMAEDAFGVGVVIRSADVVTGTGLEVEMLFQGTEDERTRNLWPLAIEERLMAVVGSGARPADVEVVTLDDLPAIRIPLNQEVLLIFLISEAALVGLFLISALVFIERGEGTFRAHRVSPGGVSELLAATIAIAVLSLPLFSYAVPGFAPAHVRALPTCPPVFAVRDAISGTGSPTRSFLVLTAWAAAAFAAAALVYRRRLANE